MPHVRLPAKEREELRAIEVQLGETKTAVELEINPATLIRAMAGVGIQRGTASHIRLKLLERTRMLATR